VSVIQSPPLAPGLDDGHAALAGRKVSGRGLRLSWSKIAASLACSGVGGFLLVDDDILTPDNLVWHDLDLRAVGTRPTASPAEFSSSTQP